MIVHLGSVAGLGLASAEVESFADLDRGKLRRMVAHRRRDRPAPTFRRLKTNHVEKRSFATRHLAVGQTTVKAFEILEAGDTLHHFFARKIESRKLFHGA